MWTGLSYLLQRWFYILLIFVKISASQSVSFWHICDIHLNISLINALPDYNSDSPQFLFSSALNAMVSLDRSPAFIIWNGDNSAHIYMENDTFIKTIQNVSQQIKDKFPDSNILPSLGNHDLNPPDQIGETSTWCNSMFILWQPFFTNSTKESNTFKRGCYYSRLVNLHNEIRKIIVLNTILWYSKNRATEKKDDPFGQFSWMKNELEDARQNKLKVFVVGHVPPGASEYDPLKYKHLHPKFNQLLLETFVNYSDIIEAGFFSHQHTDSFKIVYNSKGLPIIPLFLSPSVTPLHLGGLGSINPSIRRYTWPKDPSTRLYNQYHTEIKNGGSSLQWKLEYNSTDTLPSLSAKHLDSLLTDFSLPNSLYFPKFFKRHLSGRPHDNNETCLPNSLCRCHMLCGLKKMDYNDLELCLGSCKVLGNKSVTSGQVPMIVTVIVLFTVVLIAVIFGVNKVYCHQRRSASLTRDIFMATYNGKDCEQIVADHIDHIAEVTFGDVPEYRGHMRNNSRTFLTLNDGNEIAVEKSHPTISKFAISSKSKSQEKYDYSRM